MSKTILQDITNDFQADKFIRFFREKNRSFSPRQVFLSANDQNFAEGQKIGEIEFADGKLTVCTFEVKNSLSERSGKKAQYEVGKKILRDTQTDSGIFIFYDQSGNFRFSLIYANYLGKRRDWSTFRRFTYFASKEFTNKTFLQRIGDGDFSSLEKIKEAFSVEKVTKDFYKEIAYWYFWACKVCHPPEGALRQENGKEMFIIRLITRIVFVWFMRQKDSLVPDNLFDKQKLGEILKDYSPESSTYYKAILQNLFFATLSTEINNRKFRSEFRSTSGWNEDFGNQYVYRYYDLFQKPEMIENYFEQIPFLNGGLFECLDDKDDDNYFDGFTERKKYQPIIPNFLFFGNERAVDLNSDFGTKNKTYKVRGLIDILSSFNFTIDENTPDDQDVALDPELLGRVFENLLASFNPETSTTARKATGSYYTPREIVDYMVTESLKAYFKTHLEGIENIEEKLEILFSNISEENPLGSAETKKLVELIESVKIVDPAVGSGAFPMGTLNKLVFILGKIDPDNQLWKQAQLDAAEFIPDPQVRRNTKNQIEEFFRGKNADYGRKLYLIQKCIYGVDIQQIAVEIARLRFFISLMVDEKIDNRKENHGIEPLPNLDFKLMRGNSLIEYGSPDLIVKGKDEVKNKLIDSYFEMKEKYFFTSDHKIKKGLFDQINSIIVQLANYDYQKQYDEENKKLEGFKAQNRLFGTLTGENLSFEDRRPEVLRLSKKIKEVAEKLIKLGTDHFEWHLYFNEVFEKGGFDIVIANPPYVDSEHMVITDPELREHYSRIFITATGNWDLFVIFVERGINLLKEDGTLIFIIPNKLLSANYTDNLRKLLLTKSIKEIRDYSRVGVFIDQDIYPITLLLKNTKKGENDVCRMTTMKTIEEVTQTNEIGANIFYQDIYWDRYFFDKSILRLLLKIYQKKKLADTVNTIYSAATVSEAYDIKKYLSDDKNKDGYKLINTGTIDRYISLWGKKRTQYIKGSYMFPKISTFDLKKISKRRKIQASSPKIIIAGMSKKIEAFLDIKGEYLAGKSTSIILGEIPILISLIGLLNSKLITFFVTHFYHSLKMAGGYLNIDPEIIGKLPIPFESVNNRIGKYFSMLINSKTEAGKGIKNTGKQIDQIVYKLYGLTLEEIEIVEKI